LNAGNHTLALPPAPEGMWLYTVKSGNEQFTFKSISISNTRQKNINLQSSSFSSVLTKRTATFDDTLKVTKNGYHDFSMPIDNSVKSGIEIKLSPKTAAVAPSELIGWARTAKCGPKGTTGGGDGPPTVVVTTTAELVAALSAAGPKVIEVRGQMKGARMKDGVGVKDKTLIGTNDAFISDGMRIDKGHNIIIKNIRFGEAKVVAGDDNLADGLTIHNTTCVWIDHCEFMNSIDGNLDIVGGDGFMSSWVTVSWSKFWYTAEYAANTNKIHRFSNLIVGSDDKPDPLPYVTYHHNWWAENVTERMPRGRWAWAHVFNNYYSTKGNNYGIGVSVGIQFVVENNFFEPGFEDPIYVFNKDKGAAVRLTGNQMDGVVWKDTQAANAAFGTTFNPADHYSYTLQSPAEAKASVIAGAGRK
jgi:pectate lyase